MSSSTMPPPRSPLAHRRVNSSSTQVDSSSCVSRKMSLSKAASFHQPSLPSTEHDPVLSVAHLSKRSTTCTRSSFASWLYEGREAAADVIANFEQTFSGARGPRPATRRRSAREFDDSLLLKAQQRASSPVDSGIGSSIGSPSEKNLSRSLEKALDLTSTKDSALGESIAGSVTSEHIIQDTNKPKASRVTKPARTAGPQPLIIIRYPIPSTRRDSRPLLSTETRRLIYKRVFAPLLQEARFEEFQSIVNGTRKNKNLRCLRDIEQSLINQPVSLTVTPSQYRSFGELTIQLVVDTYQHLAESEQRQPTDRAYDNGYFLDLVQQVQQLAAHIGSSDTTVEDGSAPTVDDEITLEGGLAETGSLAELVRWKNGEGTSLRTGLPYVPMAGMKRSASNMDGPNADLSMARRKKGVEYPIIEMPCSRSDCDKVFIRKCDLSKHEKTHTRPFKCPDETCKFHELGLPTEKELDRHRNDRHNIAPKMYKCNFCEFTTKRESNCKQHMEKKHSWNYQRSKGKDKATELTPAATPQTSVAGYNSVQQSPMSYGYPMEMQSPYSHSASYTSPLDQPQEYANAIFQPRRTRALQVDPLGDEFAPFGGVSVAANEFNFAAYPTPASAINHSFTPQTPAYSNITPSPAMQSIHHVSSNQLAFAENTPESAYSHSRHASSAQDVMPQMGYDDDFGLGMDVDDYIPTNDFDLIVSDMQNSVFTREGAGNATLFHDLNPGLHAHDEDMQFTAGSFEGVEGFDYDMGVPDYLDSFPEA